MVLGSFFQACLELSAWLFLWTTQQFRNTLSFEISCHYLLLGGPFWLTFLVFWSSSVPSINCKHFKNFLLVSFLFHSSAGIWDLKIHRRDRMSPLPPNHLLHSESKGTLQGETRDSKHPVIKTFTVLLLLLHKTSFLSITLKIRCSLTQFFLSLISHHFFFIGGSLYGSHIQQHTICGFWCTPCSLSFCLHYFFYAKYSFPSSPLASHSRSEKTSFERSFWRASQTSKSFLFAVIVFCLHYHCRSFQSQCFCYTLAIHINSC